MEASSYGICHYGLICDSFVKGSARGTRCMSQKCAVKICGLVLGVGAQFMVCSFNLRNTERGTWVEVNCTLSTSQIKISQCPNSFVGNLREPTNVGPQGSSPINLEPQYRNIPAIEQPLTLWQQNINMGFIVRPSPFQNYAHQIRDCLGPQTLTGSNAGPLLVQEALTTLRMYGEICALPDREASLIKKEYCRCGPHPLQVTSSRARPPLVKGAGHIGPLFPEFRGWPLWFMASIALRGL